MIELMLLGHDTTHSDNNNVLFGNGCGGSMECFVVLDNG